MRGSMGEQKYIKRILSKYGLVHSKYGKTKPFLGHPLQLLPQALLPVLSIPQQQAALVSCLDNGRSQRKPSYRT